MSINNFSYNNGTPNLQGLETLKPLSTVKPAQNTNNAQPVSGIANDYLKVNSLNKSNNTAPIINFSQVNLNNVDSAISQITKSNMDPNQKSAQLRDLMTSLLDDEDYNAAIKVINATDSPLYKNAMFKGLIQELVAAGMYNPALNLLDHFPDKRIQNEMREYISDFINTYRNDSGLAAKFQGDESFLNVTKLKAQNIIGSVGNFFSNVGNSVSSTFSTPSTSTNLARSAESIVGKRYRYDFLDGGNLACAYTVSQALKGVKGLEGVSSNECNQLASMLSKKGFTKAYSNNNKPIEGKVNYKPGDVVFFTRKNKNGYGHVGIISEVRNGVPYMVHNSSSKREVVKVRLDQYYKVPVAVYRGK
jgi:hypothetical protein